MGKNRDDSQCHPEENPDPFETFFKKSPYPSQLLDQQGKIIQVNDAWLEEFRYNPDEVEGRQFLDFVGESSSAAFREWFGNLQQKGAVPELELEVKGKNGNISSVSLDGRSHYDENNEFLRAQCTLKETTRESSTDPERELTLELLSQLNKATSLRKLMKSVTRLMQEWSGCEAVGVRLKKGEDYPYFETRGFDREFVLSENSLCEENSEGEIVRDPSGNPVLECMCGNVIRGYTDPAKRFFSEKGSFWTNSTSDLLASASEEDKQSRTRDHCNGEGYESVALVPLRHGDETFGLLQFNDSRRGKFDRSLLKTLERLADNLTIAIKQRHDAQKLRESEEKFRQVFEEGAIGITLVDQDLNYIDINSRFCEMLGYKKDDLLSRTFVDITHPEDRGKDKDAINQLKNGEIPYYQTEKRYLRKDGEIIWCQTIATMVRRSNDLPDYFLAMAQDITEQKRRKRELNERRDELQKLSRRLINTQEEERKRISRELHDELGQSLTGLSMNLSQMKEIIAKNGKTKIKSRIGESLELVEDLSNRLDEIVSDLRPTMLDDLGLVPTLRWYLKKLNKRTDISIDHQLAEFNVNPTEEVETVLYRVTQEALTNVLKHSNADTARVKMDKLDSGLQLSIEDDGQGFETNGLASSKPDQGFGLAGIRERLYAVNGRLQINSNHGEGTRLEITIPPDE